MKERYQFRKLLDQVHCPGRRDPDKRKFADETVIDDSWDIVFRSQDRIVECAARDLADYFAVSMDLYLPLRTEAVPGRKSIIINVGENGAARSYRFTVSDEMIEITGTDPAGAGQGCYYLEDLLNLREAPFVKKQSVFREPVFSPRMVHSGWGLDQYPDSHLNAIAHAGFDSILLFVKAPGQTTHGFLDFSDLIDRCEKYGLGVYFYSYLPSFKHPEDADAEAFFDKSYGEVFKQCPKAKGIILVGESCAFPSRDPGCSGLQASFTNEFSDGIADPRPIPGFWPCNDYPQWLNAVKRSISKYAPAAEIVFWTYNWANAPAKNRLDLIQSLPEDIVLEATFEMGQVIRKYPNHQMVQPDYSITSPGPGEYFKSEAAAAKKRGLKLYSMTNTGGMTWDFGVAPYVPTPQQWCRRFRAMHAANQEWGLSGIMDSHHYGWYPSPICELAKWSFWSPETDLDEIMHQIAVREFGDGAAEDVVQAWELWSKAMDSYTPGFDDQAGPLRVGPAYPFIFHPILYPHTEQQMQFPTYPQSPVGNAWLHAYYEPEHVYQMCHAGRRIPEDIRIMSEALAIWERGNDFMRTALSKVPARKRENAERLAGVGFFCGCSICTMLNTKKWWLLNKKMEIEYDFDKANILLDEMLELVEEELVNVRAARPLVENDSRLGWEPSMDYMCDVWHIDWKIRQLTNLRDNTLRIYRQSLCRNPEMKR